jgi:hypothetical protein
VAQISALLGEARYQKYGRQPGVFRPVDASVLRALASFYGAAWLIFVEQREDVRLAYGRQSQLEQWLYAPENVQVCVRL